MKTPGFVARFLTLAACSVILVSTARCDDKEDRTAIFAYAQAAQKFDAALREKVSQSDVDTLCGQYKNHLLKTRDSIGCSIPFLTATIDREIARTESLQELYLQDRSRFARLRLDPAWMDAAPYKEASADFRQVLGIPAVRGSATDRPDLKADFGAGVRFYENPYLTELPKFMGAFSTVKGLKAARQARTMIGMPGFPKNSFHYHSYDGNFGDHGLGNNIFNRLYVVTDVWNQVVAVQFTCESPKAQPNFPNGNIGIFNFVQFRRKGSREAWVRYKSFATPTISSVLTALGDDGGIKEISVLHIPVPTKELITRALALP